MLSLVLGSGLGWGLALLPVASHAQNQGVGQGDDASFVPFGGLTVTLEDLITEDFPNDPNYNEDVRPRWQQLYASDQFSGPIDIREIRFFDASGTDDLGSLLGGTFTLRIGTSTRIVRTDGMQEGGGLGTGLLRDITSPPDAPLLEDLTRFDSNFTEEDDVVFAEDIALGDIFANGVLTFTGSPFSYDPGSGKNLLIDVEVGGYTIGNGSELVEGLAKDFVQCGFSAPGSLPCTIGLDDTVMSTVDNWDGQDNLGIGLLTVFAVPEPSTVLLLTLGLVGIGAARRVR